LSQDQKYTPALTSVHSFSSYYYSRYGGTTFESQWTTTLKSPLNSLCSGACSGSGQTPDIWDLDGDLGTAYASSLRYKALNGTLRSAAFWNLYPPLQSGSNSSGHNVTDRANYSYALNKMGMSRWYRYTHTGQDRTVTISIPSLPGVSCSTDALDMAVYQAGDALDDDFSKSGCPSVSFSAMNGQTYVVDVRGYSGNVKNFVIQVSP
jgi:hypothetical protein